MRTLHIDLPGLDETYTFQASDAVRYDAAQELTDAQKTQALANIGAESAADFAALFSETVYTPTTLGSVYYDMTLTAGKVLQITNESTISLSFYTRTAQGTADVDRFGVVLPGETHFFTVTQNADRLRVYVGAALNTNRFVLRTGTLSDGMEDGFTARQDIDSMIQNMVSPVVTSESYFDSRMIRLQIPVLKGQTVCVLLSGFVSTNNKNTQVALGYYGDSTYYQMVQAQAPGLFKIKATANYNAVYVWVVDATNTKRRATAWIDGTVKTYRTFSILGDSYSSFQTYNPSGYATAWYPGHAESVGNDCQAVEATWWYKFAQTYGAVMQINASWNGSPICYDGWGTGSTDAEASCFYTRRTDLPQSELLLIFGGTNDDWVNVELGDYVYENFSADTFYQFRPAMACMMNWLIKHHPGAKIVFIKNTGLTHVGESIDTICEHYGVQVLSLTDIAKVDDHPNTAGMAEIAAQLMYALISG